MARDEAVDPGDHGLALRRTQALQPGLLPQLLGLLKLLKMLDPPLAPAGGTTSTA